LNDIFSLNIKSFSYSAALAEEADKSDQATGGLACASASTFNETASTVNNNDEDDDDDDDDDEEEVQIDEDLFADDLEDVEEQLRETNLTT
jgi:hypothetical protein